ncbi:TPA: catalase, partial [Pseudomonas aeruginosa]
MRALLTHAWLFLGKWLGRLLLLLLAVGLGGWAIGSLYYAWKFSGPVSAEEQIAPD